MRKKSLLLALTLVIMSAGVMAQSVDDILNKYFEAVGGKAKWEALKGLKYSAKINQDGMEIPLEIIQLKDGRQSTNINFQGKVIKQGVYDGSTLWSHNFMNMKAEKSDAEATENYKKNIGDFPDAFLNYKSRGWKAELVGKESVDGAEAYKIKLTKNPIKVDGVETENVAYYFFDVESNVLVMQESEIKEGPAKGQIQQIKFSDYQEVEGLMFAFSMSQGVKGQGGQPIVISSVVVNPTVDDSEFKYPDGQ
jgi:outer membrane lipoprotein-sorting protein